MILNTGINNSKREKYVLRPNCHFFQVASEGDSMRWSLGSILRYPAICDKNTLF